MAISHRSAVIRAKYINLKRQIPQHLYMFLQRCSGIVTIRETNLWLWVIYTEHDI